MKTLSSLCVVVAAVTAGACTSKDAVLSFGSAGHVGNGGGTPPGSGGAGTGAAGGRSGAGSGGIAGTGGSGGSGGSGGAGGTGATGGKTSCETAECLRAYECVRTCGGPVELASCCPCQPPLFDRTVVDCAPDASVDGPAAGSGGATTGSGGAASGGAGGRPGSGGAGGRGGNLGSGGVGTGGSAPGDGGTDARACEQVQCARPYECIRACGGPIEYAGCCACEAPLFDNFQNMGCRGMGGTGGIAGSTCAQLREGYATALTAAKACSLASNRLPCSIVTNTVLGCSCTTRVDTLSPLQDYVDAWKQAGCALACTAVACIETSSASCDDGGGTSTTGTCRDNRP